MHYWSLEGFEVELFSSRRANDGVSIEQFPGGEGAGLTLIARYPSV
jgi:hypothetical protein